MTILTPSSTCEGITPASASGMEPIRNSHAIIGHGAPARFEEQPSALIFNHIYKCAGTTLESMLDQQFGPDYHYAGFLSSWPSLQQSLQNQTQKTIAIAGHAAWGIHELLPAEYNSFYVTILREPFARFMSVYRFGRSRGSLDRSPSDFLQGYPHNFLVKWLGNGDLHLAKVRLKSVYSLFGLVERFSDFLVMLEDLTDIQFAAYTVKNRTEEISQAATPELRAEFERLNGEDRDLYRWAEQLFEERWKARKTRTSSTQPVVTPEPAGAAEPSGKELCRWIDENNLEEAARTMERAGVPTPSHCCYLARIYEQLNDFGKSLRWYNEAVHRDIENALYLAEFLERRQLFDKATEVLNQALAAISSISVTSPDAYPSIFRQRVHALHERIRSRSSQLHVPRAGMIESPASSQLAAAFILSRMETLDAVHGTKTRIALFGNGKHTKWFMSVIASTPWKNRITCILDDHAVHGTPDNNGIQVLPPATADRLNWDIIIPSSDTSEQALATRIYEIFGKTSPTWLLYDGRIRGALPKP